MPQIGFKFSEAHEALDQFLAEQQAGGRVYERWIAADDEDKQGVPSTPAAYLVPADEYETMSGGYASWLEAQEVRDDDQASGYRPWKHSPLATTERLLPVEPLYDSLAQVFYGKRYDELPERDRDDFSDEARKSREQRTKVEVAAISCILRVTLDPDGQGAVPILSVGHHADEPGSALRWQIAYATDVPGLFIRTTGNGFFGEQFGIMTGSGWRVVDGFMNRDSATACVEALGRTLPNTDWMRLTPDDFTPSAKKAIVATVERYQRYGLNEHAPEPEPMTDNVPAEPVPGFPASVPADA